LPTLMTAQRLHCYDDVFHHALLLKKRNMFLLSQT
jgi:hypothetical protein